MNKRYIKSKSRYYRRPKRSIWRFKLRFPRFFIKKSKKRPYYGFTGYPDRCCKYDDNVFLPDELD